jgi:hypothetical protein
MHTQRLKYLRTCTTARDVNAHPEIEILENMHHCTLERKNIKG